MRSGPESESALRGLFSILLAALAGGMGWGIRGQYGHETGAMIAGLLVGLVLAIFYFSDRPVLWVARAIAMGTVAIGFGGSMTYGQTIGLTQDQPLIGNWDALRWGMLGLAIKGGIWIGFAGAFLGAALSGVRYRWWEWLAIMLGLLLLKQAGVWLINEPFDPQNKILPRIYFSDDWFWEPGSELKPRREIWGGYLVGLIGLLLYFGMIRKDLLAMSLGFWGILGGALGFPGGQALQAYHAWNRDSFRQGIWLELDPFMNWWNVMETTFGFIMGGMLALGLWWNRKRIADAVDAPVDWHPSIEWILVALHCGLLLLADYFSALPTSFSWLQPIGLYYGEGLILAIIPMVAISAGRWWPFLLILPVTALPILGKTIRQIVYKDHAMSEMLGWTIYGAIPLSVVLTLAILFGRRSIEQSHSTLFLRLTLFITAWLYFSLNYAFFQFPFPWLAWTGRTPNAIFYSVAVLALTILCFFPIQDRRLRNF